VRVIHVVEVVEGSCVQGIGGAEGELHGRIWLSGGFAGNQKNHRQANA